MWREQNLANAFQSIGQQGKVASLLAASTGGKQVSFFRQSTTERLITELGEELHAQYLLSFSPARDVGSSAFRTIRLEVKDRTDLTVRTRTGYWLPSSVE